MTHNDIQKQVQHVRKLEKDYLDACNCSKISERSENAFHDWYNAFMLLLHYCNLDDHESSLWLKSQILTENGFNLYRLFTQFRTQYIVLLSDIENGKYSEFEQSHLEKDGMKRQLVFISHASEDKAIIKVFVDKILKEGLGLRDENIIFTSFAATGVAPGEYIPKYIKDNIEAAQIVLSMVSKAYKRSEVCQNEVVASWALGKNPVQILWLCYSI